MPCDQSLFPADDFGSEDHFRNTSINESSLNSSSVLSPCTRYDDDMLVVAAWAAMGTFGFVSNVLILVGILHTKKLYQSTSYWLIISLSVCDMAMILVCLCHLSPATILHDKYVSLIDFSNAFGIFIYDGFWYTGVLHLMVMSINRYISICQPKYYLRFFSRSKTSFIIGVLYVMGIVVAVPGLFKCCYLVFNPSFYAVQYEPADTSYQFVDMAINGSSIVVMIFCYSCIVIRVRRSRIMLHQYRKLYKEQRTLQTKAALAYATRSSKDNITSKFARLFKPNVPIISRREVRLFFQFATVSFIFFASVATWGWLPQLSESKWVGFVVTSLFFLNNSTNPAVYLIFNNVLRRQIQRVLCPFKATENTQRSKRIPNRNGPHPYDDCGILDYRPGAERFQDTRRGMNKNNGNAILNRLRNTSRKCEDQEEQERKEDARNQHRRSSTVLEDDEGRLLRAYESEFNETTENITGNNATCNLMAMAAFLNTTTVTGRVLMKTMQEDEIGYAGRGSMDARRKESTRNDKNSLSSGRPLLASKENSAIEQSSVII